MKSTRPANLVIVGVGSIGKVHLSNAIAIGAKVIVIDHDVNASQFLKLNPLYNKVEFFTGIDELTEPLEEFIGVVANWGPDHFATLDQLMSRGVKRFIVEKPLVSKISDLMTLWELAKNQRINLVTNLSISFGPLPNQILGYETNTKLGKVRSITVIGGAKCLVTNGIHYVGLASKVFNSNPTSVVSTLNHQPYNPRSKEFLFMGGVAFWAFSENRHLAVTFSNDSHVQLSITIVYEYGKVIIEGNTGAVYFITADDRKKIDKPSRTYYAKEILETFNPLQFENGLDGMGEIYRKLEFSDQPIWDDFDHGLTVTEALFGMLVSNETKSLVDLPLNSEIVKSYGSREWKIS
jgi:predicted dehydrogenase